MLVCGAVISLHCSVRAATTYTWTGSGADANWATGGNWDNGTPTAGGNLVFPTSPTKSVSNNNLPVNTSFGTIQINGSGYSFSGNALATVSISTANATGTNTFTLPISGSSLTISSASAGTTLSVKNISITSTVTFAGSGNTTITGLISGGILGTNSVVKSGLGTLLFQSPSSFSQTGYIGNSWMGSAEIQAGTLQLGLSDQFPRLTTVIIDAGAILDLEDFSDACGGIMGAGTINRHGIVNSTHLFTFGANNISTDFSGVIADSGKFQKVGKGVSTLSGVSTFTGTVAIDDGTLNITGSMPTALTPGATGTLSGSGSVASVTNQGGTVSPGTPAATGVLTAQAVTFNGAGTLAIRLNGSAAGTSYDQLNVTGNIDISSATLAVSLGFLSNVSDKFTIVHATGTITGTFAGLSEGTRFSAGGNEFTISYAGGAGSDIVLTNASGSVSGTIRDAAGAGIAGVSVSNGVLSTVTGSDGTYAINIADGSITITPTKAGYTFSPPNRVVTGAGTSIAGQDFTGALILVNVSGTVQLSAGGGLPGVVVSDGTRMGTTAADGTFTILGVPYGDYSLSASKAGYFFTPPSIAISVAGDVTGQNFVASLSTPDSAIPLTVKTLSIKLNFAKANSDSFSLVGSLPVPAGFSPKGKTVQLIIGTLTRTYTLDAKGSSKSGSDSFKITFKSKKGVVAAQTSTFTIKGSKGSYLTSLAGTGIANVNAKSLPVHVPILLNFNDLVYGKSQPQSFSAKAGKTGSSK